MAWPVQRVNGFVLDATAWNEVVAALSAWGGDVNAGAHNLSNLSVLTFGAGGYIAGSTIQIGTASDAGQTNKSLKIIGNSANVGDVEFASVQLSNEWSGGAGVKFKTSRYGDNYGASLEIQVGKPSYLGGGAMNLTTVMTLLGSGYAGVGTTPWAPFTVAGHSSDPSLVHKAASIAVFSATDTSQELAVTMSGSSPYGVGLQTRLNYADGYSYPLLLNPLGGNVGVNQAAPDAVLHVTRGHSVGTVQMFKTNFDGNWGFHLDSIYPESGGIDYAFRQRYSSTEYEALYFKAGMLGIGGAPDAGTFLHLRPNTSAADGVIRLSISNQDSPTAAFDIQAKTSVVWGGIRFSNPSQSTTNIELSNWSGSARTVRMGIYGTSGSVAIGVAGEYASRLTIDCSSQTQRPLFLRNAAPGAGWAIRNDTAVFSLTYENDAGAALATSAFKTTWDGYIVFTVKTAAVGADYQTLNGTGQIYADEVNKKIFMQYRTSGGVMKQVELGVYV